MKDPTRFSQMVDMNKNLKPYKPYRVSINESSWRLGKGELFDTEKEAVEYLASCEWDGEITYQGHRYRHPDWQRIFKEHHDAYWKWLRKTAAEAIKNAK